MTARWAALGALAAVAVAVPAPAGAQNATTRSPQVLFERLVRTDDRTTSAIRTALDQHRAFVDPDVLFGDVTGDGKQDAIVRVTAGGAAGALAVYVFSVDGARNKKLHAIYRTQRLYRALTRVESDGALLVRTPRYTSGDELCCPGSMFERRLTWSANAKRLVLRSTRTYSL